MLEELEWGDKSRRIMDYAWIMGSNFCQCHLDSWRRPEKQQIP